MDHFTEKVWPNIKQIYKKEQPPAEPTESKGDEQPAEAPSVGDGEVIQMNFYFQMTLVLGFNICHSE